MEKLIQIQKKLKAPKGQTNTFGKYKYRSCEDILEAVKPLLDGAWMTLTDEIVEVGGRVYVKATATIIQGELSVDVSAYAREAETKKGMDEAQITTAASSYARKNALNGLFLIDDTKDADTQDNTGNVYIDEKQLSTVRDYIDNKAVDVDRFLKHFKINAVEELPQSRYKEAVTLLEAK